MFEEALAKTEIEIGSKNEADFNIFIQNKSKIEIEELAVGILDKMQPAVNFLIDTINNVFGPEIYGLSKIESIYSPELTPEICKIRIRPNNDYFIKHHKEIPHPDNPNGPDASGVEITFSIIRGYSIPEKTGFPKLYFHFTIWGSEERKCFGVLLDNYKRLFERLLANIKVEFFTACCFDRLEKIQSKSNFKKLVTYYENDDDSENTFSFEKTYSYGENYDDLVEIFIVFSIFYGSCLGYLNNKKHLDKILTYFIKLKTV